MSNPVIEPYDDVDDLLNMIEDVKGDKFNTKKLAEPLKSTKSPVIPSEKTSAQTFGAGGKGNNFAEVFSGEESDEPEYDPTVRVPSQKRSTVTSEDFSKKKSALFGLSNQSASKANNSAAFDFGISEISKPAIQRPQTMESKVKKEEEDDFGSINLGFSRRKGAANNPPATKERPFTSPGDLKAGSESKAKAWGAETLKDDDDDEEESEYLNAIVNRGDRKNQSGGSGNLKIGDPQKGPLNTIGKVLTVSNMQEGPMKSPPEISTSKDGFFNNKDFAHSQLVLEEKKEPNIMGKPVGILGKKELTEPQNQVVTGNVKSVASIASSAVRKEKADGKIENLQASGASVWDGGSQPVANNMGIADLLKNGAFQGYLKETEEYYKKRSKESEEYYENRFKQYKVAIDDEKRKWEEMHEKELKLVKKENEELKDNFGKHLERERERIKEVFALEMESVIKAHRYEIERQRHIFEEENDSLKRQLEAQAKLNELADEIKKSSNKLVFLSDKMEHGRPTETFGRKGEFRDKEKELEDLERQLRRDVELVYDEKKRLERTRDELERRENEDKEELQKEKALMREEYGRLTELQETIRRQEVDKMRNLEKEKSAYEHERTKLDREGAKLKEEYSRKYHELEVEVELLDIRKREFDNVLEKTEREFTMKQGEIEQTMKRLIAIEGDMMGRLREIEHQELIMSKQTAQVQSRMNLVEMERFTFEKERDEVMKMAERTREESTKLSKFRSDFQNAQEENMRVKTELKVFANSLYNERDKLAEEKSGMAMMQKNIDGQRYVRELTLGHNKAVSADPTQSQYAREKSPEMNSSSVPPYTYVQQHAASAWNSPGRELLSPENNPNYQNFRTSMQEGNKFVKLKDLKYGIHNGAQETREWRDYSEGRRMDLANSVPNGADANYTKSTTSWGGGSVFQEAVEKTMSGQTFDYNNYMKQLKEFDKKSSMNQGYTADEKDVLTQKRFEQGLKLSPKRRAQKRLYNY